MIFFSNEFLDPLQSGYIGYFSGPLKLKKTLKSTFNARDGVSVSIRTCLRSLNNRSLNEVSESYI